MSAFERRLVPGSTERPTCRCGEVMEVASIERLIKKLELHKEILADQEEENEAAN